MQAPLILFDTETTGLDSELDRIIEIGAIKYVGGKAVEEFWSFVKTDIELTPLIQNLTGITQGMIKDAPAINEVVPNFLKFIRGGILVAHNAEFDMAMLNAACNRLGYDLDWPCFCTVKLARRVLPGLPNYKLDTLAEHFKVTFEARHRAVGDVKVLATVVKNFLEDDEYEIETWADVADASIAK
ncbi:MAG: exonuclease domain-containing protein [Proteobacteria bacterium]|nr:exonuclease domain-containing protein [Pseudomonadota bacterium]